VTADLGTIRTGTALGDLKMRKEYVYYDGPLIFSCEGRHGQLYFAYWADVDVRERNRWLVVPVSPERLTRIEQGLVSLRDAILDPETTWIWDLQNDKDDKWHARPTNPWTIDKAQIPDAQVFLTDKTQKRRLAPE
jgi:hypothetical protein